MRLQQSRNSGVGGSTAANCPDGRALGSTAALRERASFGLPERLSRHGAAISASRQRPPPLSGVQHVADRRKCSRCVFCREVWPLGRDGNLGLTPTKEEDVLAIAGTGYGVIGLLVIILLVVLIVYFARRA
jgi:hypothetical protein